jgi:Domain of unknown function (DUF1844)
MTDSRDPHKKREEIRIVDRRMFTNDGERRSPDATVEEVAPPVPPPPRGPRSKGGDRGPGPLVEPSKQGTPQSREAQIASSHFKNLVLNLATTAAANLGEMPNPFTQKTEIDLEGARQVIDLLQALQLKTRGNLAVEESGLLESLLYDLQMKYVSLQTKASKPS